MPTIVVEFVSKRQRDRVRDYEEKRKEYLAVGVQEYWIIDRFRRTMTVLRGEHGTGDPTEQIIKENEVYSTPSARWIRASLARLLRVADDWARPAKTRKQNKGGPGTTSA